jgi:hypothetical protein
MSGEKYIGLDVHQATISVAVVDSQGKVVMESILETKASTLLEFLAGLRGSLFVTFEEGTWAAWLYDLLKPHVSEVLVCNPRKIPLLKQGNKSDKIDARKLAERLRLKDLKPVYHGETGVRMLRELARSYLTVVKDLSRVMNRLKALYRSWGIPCAGRDVYYTRHRSQWLEKIPEAGTHVCPPAYRSVSHLSVAAGSPHAINANLFAFQAPETKLKTVPYASLHRRLTFPPFAMAPAQPIERGFILWNPVSVRPVVFFVHCRPSSLVHLGTSRHHRAS